ncbi:uncharacterized protein ASPGLDRAFT_71541 [Aspergillus glaucus CBS 516.65]|uniref:Aminoglycoside phosphotransferase domain-containing protein n=1 Tax=Aspergillus glaucus CBS 516.65 TaxID=1160497 RepID=A0A1L9VXC1_ASPGL|nr:hypothetical protein ASPGLDRAFT_71541 [Aspergillus glaucus CBS 516.65]OJJ88527.1 hypothetical protein ASPGLDRAFT_71541 [Aspergillus glaucus CBS 516.65]
MRRKAILGLNSELVMKAGYDIDISHIFTLDYIRQQAPSIPTPETHGILQQPGSGYRFILMSRIPVSVKEQLDTIFDKLRSMLPPPTDENEPNAVFGGGNPRRCRDARTHIRVAESPISNENEFNQFFTKHQEFTQTNNLAMIKSYLETDHKLVMTHGDLHPRNIMYWEYIKALNAIPPDRYDDFENWWVYLPPTIGAWPK